MCDKRGMYVSVGMVITINDVLVRTLYVFLFYLFVSEAVLPRVLRRELAIVFLCHLSLSPQRVITEVSSYSLHVTTILCTYITS